MRVYGVVGDVRPATPSISLSGREDAEEIVENWRRDEPEDAVRVEEIELEA